MVKNQNFDVIVVGAGNAALCAALSAAEKNASVLVIEKANEDERGGNSLFTAGGFRFVHDGIEDVCEDILDDLSPAERAQIVLPALSAESYHEDQDNVTTGREDPMVDEILNCRSSVGLIRILN